MSNRMSNRQSVAISDYNGDYDGPYGDVNYNDLMSLQDDNFEKKDRLDYFKRESDYFTTLLL